MSYLKYLLRFSLYAITTADLATATTSTCTGKYYIPLDESNFTIWQRKIPYMEAVGELRKPSGGTMLNTGTTIRMDLFYPSNAVPIYKGGPFGNETYRISFMYFHWFDESSNGNRFQLEPLELHIVFINSRFENYEVASRNDFGMAIFPLKHSLTIGPYANDYYDHLKEVRYPNDALQLNATQTASIFKMISFSDIYNVYLGKSTYPGDGSCRGDVIWIEGNHIIRLNADQYIYFHELMSSDNVPLMSKIIRNTPLNTTIYKSIDLFDLNENGAIYVEPFEGFGILFKSAGCLRCSVAFAGIIWSLVVLL